MKKQSVTLRKRLRPSGKASLYLDIYIGGQRTIETLHLYLVPETSRRAKNINKDTMRLAEAIAAKRLVEVMNGEYGFKQPVTISLRDYVQSIIRNKKGSTRRRYEALAGLLFGYCRAGMRVTDITSAWYIRFMSFLERQGYAQNTLAVYAATLRYIINQAYREGIFTANPIAGIRSVGYEETNRTYLTVEEVKRLVAAPCEDEETKRAFLFGCLTGLRHCDIAALTWGDVTKQGGYTRIIFRQAKTKGQEYLDISEQAVKLMGHKGRANELVFPVPHESTMRRHIFRWVKRAGINKHVTFHASRHTFAVMQLEVGTDIYTVSKLLGHREVGTTQVYAKVLDKAKREAIDRIPDILSHRDALSDLWRTVG